MSESHNGRNLTLRDQLALTHDSIRRGDPALPLLAVGDVGRLDSEIRALTAASFQDVPVLDVSCSAADPMGDWRAALVAGADLWRSRRPGVRALHEAVDQLNDVEVGTMETVSRLDFSQASDPIVLMIVSDLDPITEPSRSLMLAMARLQDEGAPLITVLTTTFDGSFFASLEGHTLTATGDPCLAGPELASAVHSLSSDASRYFRATVSAPGTEGELKSRLGDTTAFGGGTSKLERDLSEARRAGVLQIDSCGCLSPTPGAADVI